MSAKNLGFKFVRIVLAVAVSSLTLVGFGCSGQNSIKHDPQPVWFEEAATAAGDPAMRVGTVDRVQFLVAYYRSAWREADTAALYARRDACRAAGDAKGVAAVEAEGAASQDLAHRRLVGDAPLAPIVDLVRASLPAVAADAGVRRIQEAGTPLPTGTTSVDVTSRVVALFPPGKLGPASGAKTAK